MQVPVGDEKASLWASKSSELNLKRSTVGIILNCNRLKGAQHGLLPVLPARDRSLPVTVTYPVFISNTSKKMTTVQPNEQDKPLTLPRNWGKNQETKKSSLLHNEQQCWCQTPVLLLRRFWDHHPKGASAHRPRPCPAVSGTAPCTHPGLHPAGSHRRPPPLLASANRFLHNTEAAKRVRVNWSSGRKALWAEKRKEPVVPRHQVIWNKAARRERKDAMPAHSPWRCRLRSLQPPLISAIAAFGGSREAASPKLSP